MKTSKSQDQNRNPRWESNNIEVLRDEIIRLDSELQNKIEELKVAK